MPCVWYYVQGRGTRQAAGFQVEETDISPPSADWSAPPAPQTVTVVFSGGAVVHGKEGPNSGVTTGDAQAIQIQPNLTFGSEVLTTWRNFGGNGVTFCFNYLTYNAANSGLNSLRSPNMTGASFHMYFQTYGQPIFPIVYCINEHIMIPGNNASGYRPIQPYEDFVTQYSPYHEEILWTARNGFQSKILSQQSNDSASDGIGSYYYFPFDNTNNLQQMIAKLLPYAALDTEMYNKTIFDTTNNLNFTAVDMLQDLAANPVTYLPTSTAPLNGMIAFTVTQCALWHFCNGIDYLDPANLTGDYFRVFRGYLTPLYKALIAAASDAHNNGEVITTLSVDVSLDTTGAVWDGPWYGPVTAEVNLLPVGFTPLSNVPVTISGSYPYSTTKSGGASSLVLTHDGTAYEPFYINLGTAPATRERIASASVTLDSPMNVKDVYACSVGALETTVRQPLMGVGVQNRTPDLSADVDLLYGGGSIDFTFTNTYDSGPNPPEIGDLLGRKYVEGDDAPVGTPFTFQLTQLDTADLDDIKEGGLQRTETVTTTSPGQSEIGFSFDMSFFADGEDRTYWFRLDERDDGRHGWAYDDTAYLVTVVVSSNTASVDITGPSGPVLSPGRPAFTNTYTSGPLFPPTGGPGAVLFFHTAAAMAILLSMLYFGALMYRTKKRRRYTIDK